MSKRFKEYDKKYKEYEATFFDYEGLSWNTVHTITDEIKGWEWPIDSYTVEYTEFAVYHAATHEDWQKFRVSLKGCSTQLKILRLEKRLFRANALECIAEEKLEHCRIANYIRALRRVGILNSSYRIVQ